MCVLLPITLIESSRNNQTGVKRCITRRAHTLVLQFECDAKYELGPVRVT
jgi:hypothetical protein